MAIKQTTQVGDPIIRAKAKTVKDVNSSVVKKIVGNLVDSMRKHNLVGMAAPQIGESWRIFVTEIRKTKYRKDTELDELRVFINPKIIASSKKKTVGWEGCGSVAEAGLFAKVKRPATVVVEALDENGEKFSLRSKGLLSAVIQHEIDHLNGVLFIDRADITTCMSRKEYLKMRTK